jgi:hypothetical protein
MKKVHMVWMNHLDVGFTNTVRCSRVAIFVPTTATHIAPKKLRFTSPPKNCDSCHFSHLQVASVMNIYWHEYFQRAVNTANASNIPGKPPIFKYTSHSFLLDLFFNCPATMGLHCDEPDADDVSGS